ncbi:MAG: NAD(P)-dependent oxidoreductase [Myxococcota bacterium]
MHVLIADRVAPEVKLGLEALGLRVTEKPGVGTLELTGVVKDCEILVVTDTPVTRRLIEAAPGLVLVVRAGSGSESIDVQAASERAIFVSHCPGYDAAARAEYALGLMITTDRAQASGPDGHPISSGLYGRRLGIYGYSPVAQRLAEAAARLDMDVTVHTNALPSSRAAEAGLRLAVDSQSFFKRADIVSLHPDPAGPQGAGLPPVDAAALASLAPNTLVAAVEGLDALDISALAAAVASGALRAAVDAPAAGLSGDAEAALTQIAGQAGSVVTRDRGAATAEAWRRAASQVVSVIHAFVTEGQVRDCVNLASSPEVAASLIVRHKHATRALLAITDVLAEEGIAVREVANLLFSGSGAGCIHLHLDAAPSPAAIQRISRHQDIIHVDLAS